MHTGDAAAQHLHGGELGAHIDQPFGAFRCSQGRHLVQHEQLQRHAVQTTLHQVPGGVKVRIDQAGHGQHAASVDLTCHRAAPERGHAGADCGNAVALHHDVGNRPLGAVVVECQDPGITDQQRRGIPGASAHWGTFVLRTAVRACLGRPGATLIGSPRTRSPTAAPPPGCPPRITARHARCQARSSRKPECRARLPVARP